MQVEAVAGLEEGRALGLLGVLLGPAHRGEGVDRWALLRALGWLPFVSERHLAKHVVQVSKRRHE